MFLVVLTEIEAYILSYDAKNSVRKMRKRGDPSEKSVFDPFPVMYADRLPT